MALRDRVVARLDVRQFYESRGLTLERGDKTHWKGLCLFHKESEPSLSIRQRDGWAHCFGCGFSGSLFDFEMKRTGAGFLEVLHGLAQEWGVEDGAARGRGGAAVDQSYVARCQEALQRYAEGLAYLREQRGFSDETIARYQLGWDTHSRRFTLPMQNAEGQLVGVKLYRPGVERAKWIWTKEGEKPPLFPWPRQDEAEGTLFEGEFDVILARQNGRTAWTGTRGATTFDAESPRVFSGKRVTVLYDRDEAGRAGASKAARLLAAAGCEVRIASWPEGDDDGYDLTDFLVRDRRSIEELQALLASAKPFSGPRTGRSRKKDEALYRSGLLLADGAIAEMCYDPRAEPATFFALWRDGQVEFVPDLEDRGRVVRPFPPDRDVILNRVVLLPSSAAEYGDEASLIAEVQEFIHRYVDVDGFHEGLATYYVLFSWVYDDFRVLPYLRPLGDYATGKSRYLTTVGSLCYRPIMAAGAITPAPIFRVIEEFRGTLVLDEADFRFSEHYDEIVKILNCGYEVGRPVLRVEEIGGKRQVVAYQCFGPKIIATREKFQDGALESRCLTCHMAGDPRPDIPLVLTSAFDDEATELRDKLLLWRFRHKGSFAISEDQADRTMDPRLNQILLPLMAVIRDETAAEEVRRFVVEANRSLMVARRETVEAELVTLLWERLGEGGGSPGAEGPTMKQLAADLTDRMGPEKPFTARGVGGVVDRLRLDKAKTRAGVCIVWSDQSKRSLGKLARRYGIAAPDAARCEHVNVVNVGTGAFHHADEAEMGVPTGGEQR
jgi:hypothetical protein